jgi:hypothetical protein
MTDTDHTDHKREALALRHVFQQSTDNRADMLVQLEESALPLRAVIAHARAIQREAPLAEWRDVLAAVLKVKTVNITEDIKAVMDGPAEPTDAAAAYKATLSASDDVRERLTAAAIAEAVTNREPGWQREVEVMLESQRRREVAAEDLAAGWERHRASMDGGEADKMKAIKLDPERGEWARIMNAWLGERSGLMPGKSLLIAGAGGGGKTALTSVFAWDALAAGCPVTLYQLELGRFEAVECVLRQNPDGTPRLPIFKEKLPDHWRQLLDVPDDPSPKGEDAEDALKAMARKAERLRKARGDEAHAANGLFIVDYVQLFAKANTGDAFHESLANTISKLVKTAANEGTCLVLACQVNKSAQSGELNRTSYAGADLNRLTHVGMTIERASYDNDNDKFASVGEKEADQKNGYEARLIRRQKKRGMGQPPTSRMPDGYAGVWVKEGTLRGKPDDKPQGNRAPKRLPQA